MASAKFPPLYPILDAALLPAAPAARREMLTRLAGSLAEAGVEILQYRNKTGDESQVLRDTEAIRAAAPPSLTLILNDYAQLVRQTGFHGLHLGQTDLSPHEARGLLGSDKIIGLSTHNEDQLRAAALEPVDYIAVGPVFPTASKANPDPVVGLEGIRLARSLTTQPVVAIGGINLQNARGVWSAGADSIAVISAIFSPGVDPAKSASAFLLAFKELSTGLH